MMRWALPRIRRRAATPAVAADAITGFWKTEHGEAIIAIHSDGEHYVGRIAWLREARYPTGDPQGQGGQPIIDRHNPDPARRDRPLIGLPLLTGLSYQLDDDGRAQWDNGCIYDTEHGKTYACYIRLADAERLKLHGYVGVALLGRTTTWTRVDDPNAPCCRSCP